MPTYEVQHQVLDMFDGSTEPTHVCYVEIEGPEGGESEMAYREALRKIVTRRGYYVLRKIAICDSRLGLKAVKEHRISRDG